MIFEDTTYIKLGFGTYPLKGDICFHAVLQAGKLGYRIIDTATFYKNFEPIGQALKILGREKFYIISKVWPTAQTPEKLQEDIEITLNQLQTDHVDAYLLHWPNSKIPIEDTLNTMEKIKKQGMIRHIGFSNFTVNHMKRALECNVPVSWVQVEMHPFFYDAELLKFCQEKSIGVQAWSPLARGGLNQDPLMKQLEQKYRKTAAQIALKWIIQHNCLPLPSSQNENHMRQNLDIGDFILSPEDIQTIDQRAALGKRVRINNDLGLGFTDEFDFNYEQCWPKIHKSHT